ncbi:TonB-dependent receptor [Aquisalimonas lutea]|uniref:TonB-dependent receptor domain-containing protein n=1 Tax=Aquisalimonas lutea TaxID=1327750 RepID=UPI0025B36B46|nr:TonB-dependent receptor [Aquisalimonas lutea]MDN3516744.1 TonB-dependent receptor [Aquisalimonas lutea]
MRFIHTARAAVAAACMAPFVAQANDGDSVRLNPVLVTPTLSTETAESSLSAVTVIDDEQLRRQQPRELSDVLRGQPGIDLTTNGSFGKTTSVYTRGTGSESTVLLIDGIRIRSATSGGAPWQFIPPQLIERMEIVRGPRSSLYGADAVGGVVQGFTPDGREGDSRWLRAGGGSFDAHEYGAGFAGSSDGTSWSLAGNHFATDGQPVKEDGEDRGFRNSAGIGRVTHRFDSGVELGLLGFRAQGNTEYDGGDTDFMVQATGLTAQIPLTTGWVGELQVSEARDEQESSDGSVFDTRSRNLRWDNHVFFGDHELVVGADFLRDDVDSTTAFTEDQRDNAALYGQTLLDFGDTDIQLSLRMDDNEAFGEHVTGGMAMGHDLDRNHRIRMSYGTAFRAPTFNDLYFPYTDYGFGFIFEGNPDLDPERSQTAELGFRGQYRRAFWDVAVYQTHVDDLIQNEVDAGGVTRPTNVDRARINGAELAAGAELGPWQLRSALSLTDPRDTDTGNRLRRRTTRSLRVDVDRAFGPVTVGATGIVQGGRYDDAANDDWLSGYGLVNLRAGWAFARNWSARLTVDNVFDKDYETAGGYRNAGRSAFVSVRYGVR